MPKAREVSAPAELSALASGSSQLIQDYEPLRELLSPGDKPEDIDLRTELNDLQVVTFSVAIMVADHFEVPALKELIYGMERRQVSLKRKGRKEFVQSFQSAGLSDQGEAASIFSRMKDGIR